MLWSSAGVDAARDELRCWREAASPHDVTVYVLPTGEHTYVNVLGDTAAGAMVECWPAGYREADERPAKRRLRQQQEKRRRRLGGGRPPAGAAPAAQARLNLFLPPSPQHSDGDGAAARPRRSRHACERQKIHLFDETKDSTLSEMQGQRQSCLRPIHRIWGENEGPRCLGRAADVNQKRAGHALSAWSRKEAAEALRSKFDRRRSNKERVPLSILRAKAHDPPRRSNRQKPAAPQPQPLQPQEQAPRAPTAPPPRKKLLRCRVVDGAHVSEGMRPWDAAAHFKTTTMLAYETKATRAAAAPAAAVAPHPPPQPPRAARTPPPRKAVVAAAEGCSRRHKGIARVWARYFDEGGNAKTLPSEDGAYLKV